MLATSTGWLLGIFVLFAVLFAGEIMNAGESWLLVCVAGMATVVGCMQQRVLTSGGTSSKWWMWSTAIGMGMGFVLFDLLNMIWEQPSYPLRWDAPLGGLLTGLLQLRVLRKLSIRPHWWVPVCLVGWTLASLTAEFGGTPLGFSLGPWFSLGTMLFAGVILGLVTGGGMAWLLRYSLSVGPN